MTRSGERHTVRPACRAPRRGARHPGHPAPAVLEAARGAAAQRAYRISADNGWDTGRVTGDQQRARAVRRAAAVVRQRVTWRVKVWTDLGESAWSAPCWFEMGLLGTEDWQAEWIEPASDEAGRPASLVRHEFTVDRPVTTARLHVTAHGLYEVFLNGVRVGDAELTPGFTQYDARLQVQTYDVTAQLRTGRNAIGVVLADGWYRGQVGITRGRPTSGATGPALLAQLILSTPTGRVTVLGTGPGWRDGPGAHPRGRPDRRRAVGPAPAAAGLDRRPGSTTPAGRPCRRWPTGTPVSSTRPRRRCGGSQEIDAGLGDAARRPAARSSTSARTSTAGCGSPTLGPAGTTVTLIHGEQLGRGRRRHHRAPAAGTCRSCPSRCRPGRSTRWSRPASPGDVFEPRRTTHGFRYVRVEGHPDD